MHLDKYIHGVRFTSTRFGNGLIASETNIGLTVRRIILKRVLASRYVENNHLFVYKPDKKFSIHVPGPSSRGLSPQVHNWQIQALREFVRLFSGGRKCFPKPSCLQLCWVFAMHKLYDYFSLSVALFSSQIFFP